VTKQSGGILRKAREAAGDATLVFGLSSEGKSTEVVNAVLETKKKAVLWVSFTNLAAVIGNPKCADWDIAEPTNWRELIEFIVNPVINGDMKYDVIVLDGIHYMATHSLEYEASLNTDKAAGLTTQANWGDMGSAMKNAIIALKAKAQLFCITDAEWERKKQGDEQVKTGNLILPFNNDLFLKIISLFGSKWYCYTAKGPDEATPVAYLVQRNSSLAMRFKK